MGFDVGQTFGDYSITALLNAGGMGRVYKVEHCLTKRTEAMKVLASELATEIQTKRFEREMRALAPLRGAAKTCTLMSGWAAAECDGVLQVPVTVGQAQVRAFAQVVGESHDLRSVLISPSVSQAR